MTACWAGVKTAWFVVGACPVGAGDPVVDMGVGRCPASGGAGVAVAIGSSGPVCARGASLAMGVSIVAGASVVVLEWARGAALAMGMSRGVLSLGCSCSVQRSNVYPRLPAPVSVSGWHFATYLHCASHIHIFKGVYPIYIF